MYQINFTKTTELWIDFWQLGDIFERPGQNELIIWKTDSRFFFSPASPALRIRACVLEAPALALTLLLPYSKPMLGEKNRLFCSLKSDNWTVRHQRNYDLKNTFYFWTGLSEMIIIYHSSHVQPRRDKALSSLVYSLFEKWFWRVYLRFQRLCNTDCKIFHRHLKIVAYWMVLLFVWLAKDDGNFHPRIFSHCLKMTVEFSTVILSYNRTREYLKTLSSFLVIWQNLFQSCIF